MSATIAQESVDRVGSALSGLYITPGAEKDGGGGIDLAEGDLLLAQVAVASDNVNTVGIGNCVEDSSDNSRIGYIFGEPVEVASPWSGHDNALQLAQGDFIGCDSRGLIITGNFCLEMKIRPTALPGATDFGMAGRWGDAVGTSNYLMNVGGSGAVSGHVRDGGGTQRTVTDPTGLSINTSYDYALTYDGTTLRLFRDGTIVASLAVTGVSSGSAATPFRVGSYSSQVRSFVGPVDEVRLSDIARYTANYTPATTPLTKDSNTLLLWHLDDVGGCMKVEDASSNDRDLVVINTPQLITSPVGSHNQALDLDGTNDLLLIQDPELGVSGPFCFEMRARPDSIASTMIVGGLWVTGTVSLENYLIWYNQSAGKFVGSVINSAGAQINVTGTTTVVAGTTYALALAYDGTTLRLFVDGAVEASTAVAGLQSPASTVPFVIGGMRAAGNLGFDSQRWNGVVDEARLSSVARYTSGYTPSSTPLTDDADTLGLWHMDALVLDTASKWASIKQGRVDGGSAVAVGVWYRYVQAADPKLVRAAGGTYISTDGVAAKVLRVLGAHESAPIAASAVGTGSGGSATFNIPTATSTENDQLVLRCGAFGDASVTTVTGVASELYDYSNDPGNAVSIAMGRTTKATAGAVGTETWTLSGGSGVDSRVGITVILVNPILATVLVPIRAEMSLEASAEATIGDAEDDFPDEVHDIAPPDPNVFVKRIVRVAPDVAAHILDSGRVDVDAWTAAFPEPTYEDWGKLRIKVGGKWVTYWRGVAVEPQSWEDGEPFGYGPAIIRFPQINSFEELPDFLQDGSNIDIYRADPEGELSVLWQGMWVEESDSMQETANGLELQCIGALHQLDFSLRRPRLVELVKNVGRLLAEIVTPYGRDRTSMRFRPLNKLTLSGLEIIPTGDWSKLLTGFVADVLGQSWLEDGSSQWTIGVEPGRKPVLKLKDRTTEHYSVHVGEPGVTHDLVRDLTQAPTTAFGEGIGLDGCRWRNSKYPNLRLGDAPVFGGIDISVGDSPPDMAIFEQEMFDRGWGFFNLNGVYDADKEEIVRAFQRDAGITEDGVIDAQTWAAVFVDGIDAADPRLPFIHSIYTKSYADKWRRAPDGSRIGLNPDYDRTKLRIERYSNYGNNISKAEAMRSARLDIERSFEPSYIGTITLRVDPPESSRFEIRAGENIVLRGHRGTDRLLHIAHVEVDWPGQTVTLTVDEKARDVMTLAAMLTRDRETTDPARRPRPKYFNSSRRSEDRAIVWDCENGAGVVPYHAITAGRWQVIKIPTGKYGRVVRARFEVDTASRMAVGVFDRPVTANQMVFGPGENAGDPLFYEHYWQVFGPPDEPINPQTGLPWIGPPGLIEAWGSDEEPGGYYPGRGSEGASITGVLQDSGSWEYASSMPPWLWIAMWVETGSGGFKAGTNYIRGRLYQSNDTV